VVSNSVVLVTVDCLRADHVGFLGYDRLTTPFLDSLASESVVLPAAVAAGSPTYYSFPATFASRPPLALGRDVLGIAPGEPTLASVLLESGYRTAAFSAANPYISPRFGYESGFDTFEDFLSNDTGAVSNVTVDALRRPSRINQVIAHGSHQLGPLGNVYDELYFQYCQRWATSTPKSMSELRRFPSADVVVNAAIAWLNSIGDSPFFLWLHLMDPHAPYYPTEEGIQMLKLREVSPFRARYLNSLWQRKELGVRRLRQHRDDVVGLYDAGIRWVDFQVKRLVENLRDLGHWQKCVFALTADHGEEFLDHGGRFHPPVGLFEEIVHVPFMLRVPSLPKKSQPKSAFSLLNLSPTLLDALQIEVPTDFFGKSCWARMKEGIGWDEPAIIECVSGCTNPFWPQQRIGPRILGVRDSRYKLILHFDESRELMFDLEVDPRELSPLPVDADRPIRRRLLDHARAHLAAKQNESARLRARIRDIRLECAKPVA